MTKSEKPRGAQLAKAYLRHALPTVASFGIGYGAARTLLERTGAVDNLSPRTRAMLEGGLALMAAHAGYRANKAVLERATRDAKGRA